MFGPPGRAYVYLVYGMYDCLNVVTGEDGAASAVLLRAVEPLIGLEVMAVARSQASARRRKDPATARPATVRPDRGTASGPGRLCAAFGVDRSFTGVDLCDPALALHIAQALPDDRPPEPTWTPRVGVAYAGEPWASLAWRLVDRSSPSLSTAGPGTVRPDPDPQPAGLEPSA